MAAYSAIARYRINGATSGTGPTTFPDDTGNGNTANITYNGVANWNAIAAGSGFQMTAVATSVTAAVVSISNITTTGNIGSTLNNATEASFLIVADITTPTTNASTLLRLGSTSASAGYCNIYMTTSRTMTVVWGDEYGTYNGAEFITPVGTGVRVLAVVVDTSQAVATDRVKIWDNGVALTPDYTDMAQNRALTDLNVYGSGLQIGNRSAGERNTQGTIYYVEIGTGSLNSTQISDSYAALIADNDSDWDVPPVLSWVAAPTADQETTSSVRINLTTSLAATIDILDTSIAATQPSDAAFDAASFGGSSTAYTVFHSTYTGLVSSTERRFWVRADDGTTKIYAYVNATTSAITSTILSINGNNPIKYGQTGIVVLWDAGATGTTSTTINGVTQASHTVISDTETRFDLVWPATLYGTAKTLTIGGESLATPVFIPADGYSFITLSGYNPAGTTGEVETSPAAVNGDQLVYNNETNTISIAANGIPTFTGTFDGTMSVAVVDQSDGSHSSFATITYNPPADIVPTQFDLGADVPSANPSSNNDGSFVIAGVTTGVDITVVPSGAMLISTDGVTYVSTSIIRQLGQTVYHRLVAGTYNAVVTGSIVINGITDSRTVTTRAAVTPTITSQPTTQTVAAGQNAAFIVAASNVSAYQWFEETGTTDTPVSGATSSTYVRTTVLGDNGKQFYCRLTSSEGGITYTNTVTLNVNPATATITSDTVRDAKTKLVRTNATFPVRIRASNNSIVWSGNVTTNSLGIFTLTNDQMGTPGTVVYVETPDAGSGSYSGFTYTLT